MHYNASDRKDLSSSLLWFFFLLLLYRISSGGKKKNTPDMCKQLSFKKKKKEKKNTAGGMLRGIPLPLAKLYRRRARPKKSFWLFCFLLFYPFNHKTLTGFFNRNTWNDAIFEGGRIKWRESRSRGRRRAIHYGAFYRVSHVGSIRRREKGGIHTTQQRTQIGFLCRTAILRIARFLFPNTATRWNARHGVAPLSIVRCCWWYQNRFFLSLFYIWLFSYVNNRYATRHLFLFFIIILLII